MDEYHIQWLCSRCGEVHTRALTPPTLNDPAGVYTVFRTSTEHPGSLFWETRLPLEGATLTQRLTGPIDLSCTAPDSDPRMPESSCELPMAWRRHSFNGMGEA